MREIDAQANKNERVSLDDMRWFNENLDRMT